MATLYKWRVYCTTDATNEYVWSEEEPKTCPTNTLHVIDEEKTSIDEIREVNLITIKEENTPTGGNFKAETVGFDIPAETTESFDISWKIPINVLEMCFHPTSEEVGNFIDIALSPDTTVGIITSDVSVGDTEISANEGSLDYFYKGYEVKLSDGENENNLGIITNINIVTKTITVENPATNSFSASTPTYIKQTIYLAKHFEINASWKYAIGESKIGGNYIPANTIVRVSYENKSTTPVRFVATLEYLY